MYVLLPDSPSLDFLTLLVTFVLATLLGFLSHAPGSLGVFDAAMLVGLAQFDRNELVAALLLFRLLYFILPFFTALCILSTRELWLSLTGSGNGGPPAPGRGARPAAPHPWRDRIARAHRHREPHTLARWRQAFKRASLPAKYGRAPMGKRLAIYAALACAAGLTASACLAEDYPARPIRVVVGFSAGSGADITARVVGQRMSQILGQQIVVENKTGAGSSLAADLVARAPKDGYTLLMATIANVINAVVTPNLAFDFR